jgi:GNAT superfamily N-acetyltransferase
MQRRPVFPWWSMRAPREQPKTMSAKYQVVDVNGKAYPVELPSVGRMRSAVVYDNKVRIAVAHVIVDGDSAHLADIEVKDRLSFLYGPFGLFRRTLNYRGKGIGTSLLQLLCAELARTGVRVLEGEMHGDERLLRAWYSEHGFIVDGIVVRRFL